MPHCSAIADTSSVPTPVLSIQHLLSVYSSLISAALLSRIRSASAREAGWSLRFAGGLGGAGLLLLLHPFKHVILAPSQRSTNHDAGREVIPTCDPCSHTARVQSRLIGEGRIDSAFGSYRTGNQCSNRRCGCAACSRRRYPPRWWSQRLTTRALLGQIGIRSDKQCQIRPVLAI